MAPDSSLVMSSRLAMKRFSRSDSSITVARRSRFSGSLSPLARSRMVEAAPSTDASGVLRSCEIEVSSAERKRSDSTDRLTRSISSTSNTRSIASAPWSTSASSRRRWSGVSSGPDLSSSIPMTPIAPRPVRGGKVSLVQFVFGRIAGLDGEDAVLGQQQHHPHLQHQRDLVGGRPQYVVQRRGARQLAAEGVERFGGAHPDDRG